MEKLKVKIEDSVDKVSVLENISYYLLIATAFLLPIFFIPSVAYQFQFSKAVFISLAALVSFALWIIARLKDGRFLLPNNIAFLASGIVILAVFISSLFSDSLRTSFIGQGSEIGTWANVVVLFVLMFMFSALARPKERVFYLYLSLFLSFCLIVLFHALRFLFGADFLSFGIFTDITSNLIGKWNDLGIFFGLLALLSLITLELMQVNRLFQTLLWIVFVLSVLSLCVVNFATIWYVLAAMALLYYVYAYVYKGEFVSLPQAAFGSDGTSRSETQVSASRWQKIRRGSALAVVVILVSIIFLADNYTGSKKLGTSIANRFKVSHLEVRPNWKSTLHVAKGTLRTDLLLGVGPNRFVNEWLLYKPDGINASIFWNTDFNFGIGLIPTFLITNGVLGLLAWAFLLLSLLYLGIRYLLTPITDKLGRYLSVSSFFASLFLWTFVVFYIPSTVILALTFLFTGLFIASLYNERLLKPKTISFSDEPKATFPSVLVLTALLVGVIALSYIFGQKFTASADFQRALVALNVNNDSVKAQEYATGALSISKNDLYDRLLTELTLTKINSLLSRTPASASAEAVRAEFQTLMGEALSYAKGAVDVDSTNYQNWVSLGRVYEAVVPLGIQGAYESAKAAYDKALTLNPSGPNIQLIKARLELARNNRAQALEFIDAARKLKDNYTEAIFLLSQIQASEGKVRDAIASVESAAVLAPNDPSVFFQLGLLRYNNRDYRAAAEALNRAVLLAPTYSNAKYFLGLSYHKLGRTSDALTQFNDINVLNPGNTEVPVIIKNIKEGRDPFESIQASATPDKRRTLPVEEKKIEEK